MININRIGDFIRKYEREYKAQRNYLVKLYGITMEDISVLDKRIEKIRERWIKLQQKPKPLGSLDQYKERCLEKEARIYEKASRELKILNEEISYRILQFNANFGYEATDLDSDHNISDDETPTESENEESGEESDESPSDNDSEIGKRAVSPTPYPCCNEIQCTCCDNLDAFEKEYEEYCQNYYEQMNEEQ